VARIPRNRCSSIPAASLASRSADDTGAEGSSLAGALTCALPAAFGVDGAAAAEALVDVVLAVSLVTEASPLPNPWVDGTDHPLPAGGSRLGPATGSGLPSVPRLSVPKPDDASDGDARACR
jgi:hypothetical protein